MITILGGEVHSALGGVTQQVQRMKEGIARFDEVPINIFDEVRTIPYYRLPEHSASDDGTYDPIPMLLGLIDKLIQKSDLNQEQLSRCGLFLGCASNDLSILDPIALGMRLGATPDYGGNGQRVGNGLYAERIINHYNLHPLSLTYNTACTSGANAILGAQSLLESGVIDYALVIGVEMLAPHSISGFIAMQLITDDVMKPFDEQRQGLILGESLSALLLSRKEIKDSDWELLGASSQCETYSVTGVNSDGSGIEVVLNKALEASEIKANEITAVKTHGTGSFQSDLSEVNGMTRVFGLSAPPFTSLKPYIGHTLGSCAVSEMVLFMNAIDHNFIPATPNFSKVDTNLQWQPLTNAMDCNQGTFLLNCFGFGGNNNAMIIKKTLV